MATSSGDRQRQDSQPAFVLHSYPFRETSLVVEVFARNFGRIGLVARGARRPRSALRGLLMAFQPLLLSWAGKSELRTLHKAEWQGGVPQLRGIGLMCGFYLNELLLKFLAREDPHAALFDVYFQSIGALAREDEPAATLRRFEKHLLKELGYALVLDVEADTGEPVVPQRRYTYAVERGPLRLDGRSEVAMEVVGTTLLDMACDNFDNPTTMAQSKILMRFLINHYLGNQELHTRQLLRELQQI